MTNQEIAKILKNISIILEIKGDSKFRVIAFERAADVISNLTKDIEDIYTQGGIKALEEVPGVGQGIAERIEELLKTGKMKDYQKLTSEFPEKMLVLTDVPGIGAKTAFAFFKKLKIDSIAKLEKAAKSGAVSKLSHFKEKSVKNLLRGIEQYKARAKEQERMLLTTADQLAGQALSYLKRNKLVKRADAVGSLRRMKETIGDIDLIISTPKPQEVVNYFAKAPFIKNILSKGNTKISITHNKNIRIDVEILPELDYGSLLQHFTGSKEHNVHLRTWAEKRGLSISEYGIKDLKKKKLHHFSNEKDLYKFLGMQYIEPELREDRGEIEAALENKLPKIIGYNDLLGDLHCHTNKSDGSNTIFELAAKALKMKYKYLGISDHTAGLGVASGLTEKNLLKHKAEIQKINKKFRGIKLLAGAEINILANGKLDISRDIIKKLDYGIGSVHSAFNQDEETMTKRVLNAIKSGIKIFGHPSGRLLGQRQGYDLEWTEIFKACAKYNVALEINSFPERLDLKDTLIKDAQDYGCKFAIDSDAHSLENFDLIKYGIATARRGWATKKDIINTWDLDKLLKWFKS
ncbi:DNA polymerase/3'-5' exonuclease PolX [Candidatus Falkowbacteria bacterium]|nr:DNA polymerase/3'-5' exonuclease PolX [Candidatus Falkowbacteria bacterium]